MSYRHYSEDDFFHDPKFREWVLNPDPELNYFWETWMINNPEKISQVKIARRLVKAISIEEYAWEAERKNKLWRRINNTISKKSSNKNTQSNIIPISHNYQYQRNKSWFKSTWLRAAVVSFLLVSGIYFVSQKFPVFSEPEQQIVHMIEKENPKGQKSKVFLPDGSVVYLNSLSKITYPQNFDAEKRMVQLEGEAFFEVVPDSIRPFVVQAGDLNTTVLGTSFNVRAFSEQDYAKVSLVEGKLKVALKNENNSVVLNSGQSATLNNSDMKIQTGVLNYILEIGWKDGIIYFDNTPLQKAMKSLEVWYGVNFHYNRVPDSKVLVTGKFENEYLTNVLKSLSYSVQFEYTIKNGSEVNINFK